MMIADSVKHIIEKKYELGGRGKTFDCLSYFITFYKDMGFEFPTEYKGWTLENYVERWLNGEGRETFTEFLQTLGWEIDVNYMLEGDLILIMADNSLYPCIYLGSGHVMIVSIETGTTVIPLWAIKPKIVEVRRLING